MLVMMMPILPSSLCTLYFGRILSGLPKMAIFSLVLCCHHGRIRNVDHFPCRFQNGKVSRLPSLKVRPQVKGNGKGEFQHRYNISRQGHQCGYRHVPIRPAVGDPDLL